MTTKNQHLTKGQETKLRIIRATMELVENNGFENTSFQMIAKASKMSQQGVMNHYKNRDALFNGILSSIKEKLYTEIKESFDIYDNGYDLLQKHFLAQLITIEKHPVTMQMYLWLYFNASFNPVYKKIYTETLKEVRKQYMKYILVGKREGIFNFDTNVEVAAEKLHEFVMGSIINYGVTMPSLGKKKMLINKWKSILVDILNFKTLSR